MKKVEILMQKKSPENTHYWGTDHCMADYQVIILPIRELHFSVAMEKKLFRTSGSFFEEGQLGNFDKSRD